MNYYSDIDKYGDNIAIRTESGEELTYTKFLLDADTIVEKLESRKLVFLVCRNCLESVCAYIGALRKGVIPVMINAGIDADLYNTLFETYKPAYIYAPFDFASIKADFVELAKYRDFTMYATACDTSYPVAKELALLLTTSGSTGSPKLVRQSYTNITANANSIAQYLEIVATDRAITTMPMSYTYCLSIINSHLLMGASIVMNEYSVIQREFWNVFSIRLELYFRRKL